jgi:hypothetical protein
MTAARSARSKAPVLHLVPKAPDRDAPEVNRDTVDCLMLLLKRALKGEVIGLAYAAQLPDRAYIVDTAGAAQDSPTYARGMVRALDDEIASRMRALQ